MAICHAIGDETAKQEIQILTFLLPLPDSKYKGKLSPDVRGPDYKTKSHHQRDVQEDSIEYSWEKNAVCVVHNQQKKWRYTISPTLSWCSPYFPEIGSCSW